MAINHRDVPQAVALIDDQCCYEDLNFSATFMGRAAVEGLFTDSCRSVPEDLQFVIDDMAGDDRAVGVSWHVELNGMPFPNGRGVSFYRISPQSGKLIYGRDCVEPPLKPGKVAFAIIRWVTPLVLYWLGRPQRPLGDSFSSLLVRTPTAPFPMKDFPKDLTTDPAKLLPKDIKQSLSGLVWLLWAATLVYVGLLLLSPPGWLPGEPIWAIRPDTIQEILNESLNFFFILPLLNLVGISYIQAPMVNPAIQGFFNLAEAWIFMFLPLMLMDRRGRQLPRIMIWGLAMFLTNVFLMPYMALRLGQPLENKPNEPLTVLDRANPDKGILAHLFGALGLTVGNLAVIWFFFNRPELGGGLSRLHYLGQQLVSNRVTLAFAVDMALFWIFQAWLMGAVIPVGDRGRFLRLVPFWGLAIWLLV